MIRLSVIVAGAVGLTMLPVPPGTDGRRHCWATGRCGCDRSAVDRRSGGFL